MKCGAINIHIVILLTPYNNIYNKNLSTSNYNIFNSIKFSVLCFLHVQDAIEDNVSELDSPLHGEVRPVQVGGEKDEADPMFRVPVEHGATKSHEPVPAFHVISAVLIFIFLKIFRLYLSLKTFSPPCVM